VGNFRSYFSLFAIASATHGGGELVRNGPRTGWLGTLAMLKVLVLVLAAERWDEQVGCR